MHFRLKMCIYSSEMDIYGSKIIICGCKMGYKTYWNRGFLGRKVCISYLEYGAGNSVHKVV